MAASRRSTVFLHQRVERTAERDWMGVFYTGAMITHDVVSQVA